MTTFYYYIDGVLYAQDKNSNILTYLYDDKGVPYAFTYNGTKYYYEYNLQGDVIGLFNSIGTRIAYYTYDPWGKPLTITNVAGSDISGNATHIANINPLRYRGYYYDVETGLYYCNSRYYDPETGRFINADGEIAGVGGEVMGYNMFAYCFNNPVNMSDPSGNWPKWIKNFWTATDKFLTKIAAALSESFSASLEVGSGFGATGKARGIDLGAQVVLVGDEWWNDGKGNKESTRKAEVNIVAAIKDVVGIQGRIGYSAPLKSAEEKGLIKADNGNGYIEGGVFFLHTQVGNLPTTKDLVLNWGLSGYFILGGGFEASLNVTKFIEVWEAY